MTTTATALAAEEESSSSQQKDQTASSTGALSTTPSSPPEDRPRPTATATTTNTTTTTTTTAMTTTASTALAAEEETPPSQPKDRTEQEEQGSSPPWPQPYYLQDGLRRVAPYFFTYKTNVKERWRGRRLIDVFESEFRDRPPAYYRRAMETGGVVVDGQLVGPDHVLRNGELISHSTHRHEPPVTAAPVTVMHEDAEMLVINKPAGMPVHPAGRYNYNSVIEILKAERPPGFAPYPCNRLDRLTSGVMFVAKERAAAERLSSQIQDRTVRKEYVARVVGRFPDGHVVCDMPILQISPKLGLNRVRANGRPARTVFHRLAYYPDADGADEEEQEKEKEKEEEESGSSTAATAAAAAADGKPWRRARGYSIVRCLPVTGRTHQLRVHLQHLGHPIQNDPIYANQKVWGWDLGRDDASGSRIRDEDVISRLARMGKEDVAQAVAYYDEVVDDYHRRKAEKMSGRVCPVCQTPLYTDPGPHELALWLHSLRYEDARGTWSYATPLPAWALPPDGIDGPTRVVASLDALVQAAVAAGGPQDGQEGLGTHQGEEAIS